MDIEHMPNTAVPYASLLFPPRRLLILGCSKAKTAHEGLVPAIERYDGPAFRVLRRYLRERHDPALRILVLSAEYGIIAADAQIPRYDRRMTLARARELQCRVSATLSRLLHESDMLPDDPHHVFVVLGKAYREAVSDYVGEGGHWLSDRCVSGPPGQRLAQLKTWLNAESPI
jgi:hypothetical protein